MLPGAFLAKKNNGEIYYRSSITFLGRHISLGSYNTEADASQAYFDAKKLLDNNTITLVSLNFADYCLKFDKIITILNFRDNHIYIKTPIYLQNGFFLYYLTETRILKFDNDDLFYYSSHKIQYRGGHLFVSDYGMQYNILSRYGIKNFAVAGRDYTFANNDNCDYRYSNIVVINKYHGVTREDINGSSIYTAKIHLNGDFIVGRFSSEEKAAVAYNKAVDFCKIHGFQKDFIQNYVLEYTASEYANVYSSIKLPKNLRDYFEELI